MSRSFKSSIGRKLFFAVGIPAVLVAFLGLLWIKERAERQVEENTRVHLAGVADLIVAAFTGAHPGPHPHAAVLAALAADLGPEVSTLEVFGADGVIKFASDRRKVASVVPDRVLAAVLRGDRLREPNNLVRPIIGTTGCGGCHVSVPGVLGGLHVSIETAPLSRELNLIYRDAIVALVLFVLGVSLATWVSMRMFVAQPLKRLSQAMLHAQGGDFLSRVKVESDDELGKLAENFNTMLAAITGLNAQRLEDAQSIESMKRELRLKAQVEAQHRLLDETNRRLEGRLRELTLLFDLTRTINSTLELPELLGLMTELVGGTLGFNEFVLLLLDEETDELVVKTSYGIESEFEGERFKVGEGAVGWAAHAKELLLIRDTKQDARYLHYKGRRPVDGSNLSVPMIYKGHCVGVLNFFKPVVDAFNEDEIRFLQSVANQAAMAIANARLHQQTVELSLTDALTGVYNRRHLFSRLEMELTRAQRFDQTASMVMIDVDHFKHYNDNWGHPAGDQVLRDVGRMLSGAVRKIDTVARYGGEEFAVLLPRITKAQALEVAEKLRRLIANHPFPHGEHQAGGRVTISVGVASYPDDAVELADLVDCSDSALYAAKKAGRNNVQGYSSGMRENPGRERSIEVTANVEQTGT